MLSVKFDIFVPLIFLLCASSSILSVSLYFKIIELFNMLSLLKWNLIDRCFNLLFSSPVSIVFKLDLLSVYTVTGFLKFINSFRMFFFFYP